MIILLQKSGNVNPLGQLEKSSGRKKVHDTGAEFNQTSEENYNELLIIPGAVHTDLYDKTDIIPFDRITAFFNKYLKA